VERRYVGIDLHRRRSVIYTMTGEGERVSCVRIANDPVALSLAVADAGGDADVVIEATYGWYWAVDLLQADGHRVHLAHPSGNDWGNRRVKNDERDARDLADLLRLGRLAEAWIAPPAVRELRELVRFRAKLVALRSGLKAQVHAVMAKEGVLPGVLDMFGPGGNVQLDALEFQPAYTNRIESLRDLIERYDREVGMFERLIHQQLRDHTGYQAIQVLTGVGRTIAAIFVAEIGDVARFRSAAALCSWAGLTLVTASPTPKSCAVGSPRWVRGWCAVPRSRPSPATRAAPGSSATSVASPSGAARTKRASPWPASSSRSSTTACATARSAARPTRRRRERSDTTTGELVYRHDPPLRAWSTYVIEPLMVVAEPHHAPRRGRRDVSAAEPALPHHRGEPWCGPRVRAS
jgi:transposase